MPPKSFPSRPRFNTRLGGWLPHDDHRLKHYMKKMKSKVRAGAYPMLPVVKAFKDLIEDDGIVYSACAMMIRQANLLYGGPDGSGIVDIPEEERDGLVHLTDYVQMCDLINVAIHEPPQYNNTDLVAFPINAIFDYSMNTPAGMAFFSFEKVNKCLGDILKYWGNWLSSKQSLIAFLPSSEGGGDWMSPEAVGKTDMDQFVQPDPDALGWGYKSWNAWFIRSFKPGMRPVADPDNPKTIVSACESTPFDLETNVQLRSTFWLKGQPYSLAFMLGSEDTAKPFVGGTVYQAFLSAFNYHRWHAPIDGVVIQAFVIPGTYYAQTLAEGFDPAGPDTSQGFISNVAARAVFIIRADHKPIGDMAFVAIGMSEVSSNIITAQAGDHVKKGDDLGYFLFGGSTHCLVFQNGAVASWEDQVTGDNVVDLSSKIATAF